MRTTVLALAMLLATAAPAQSPLAGASSLVIPQSRAFALRADAGALAVASVQARVSIVEGTARTALEIAVRNPGATPAQAVLLLPVPDGAAVSSFLVDGASDAPTARVLPRDEARRLYDDLVGALRDPALLEFAGYDLIRSSVFPVAAGAVQRVHVTYEHLLPADGGRVDYTLPRSESLAQQAAWEIHVEIRSASAVSTIYSPSHAIETTRISPTQHKVRLAEAAAREPGPFLLSYLLDRGDDVTASLFTYPDAEIGGGYFLLLAGLPEPGETHRAGLRREVTIVLDRSGSMAGAKLEQARAAARQVIEGLADGEGFNIVDYGTTVAALHDAAVPKDAVTSARGLDYLAALRPGGGTNIHGALARALAPPPLPGTLPIVLFVTDGLPTVGETSEVAIHALLQAGNLHARRVFTFGVGHDVNVPLLDWIADRTRATTTYVLPKEDVEVEIGRVFRKLYGPVLSGAALHALDAGGGIDASRIRAQQPPQLPDLFENDRLVVLGQYRGDEPLPLRLDGDYRGTRRTFEFRFDVGKASSRSAFVPRLWASRQIAYLIDRVRQTGAPAAAAPRALGDDPLAGSTMRELRDEILRLSARFGVLSEYTAFLAAEETRLSDWNAMASSCGAELGDKAVRTRSGIGAVNQGANLWQLKNRVALDYRNTFLDGNLEPVAHANVQQVGDLAFFRRGKRWVDGRAIVRGDLTADRVVRYGSPEHRALLRALTGSKACAPLSLQGEVLLRIGDQNVLVVNDDC